MKAQTPHTSTGAFISLMTLSLSGSTRIPEALTIKPRYLVCYFMNLHLLIFIFKPCFLSLAKTSAKCSKCSSTVGEWMITSSRYATAQSQPVKTFVISSWKTLRTFVTPVRHTSKLLNPFMATFCLSFSSIGICQNRLFKSNELKTLDFPSGANTLSITGNGVNKFLGDLIQLPKVYTESVFMSIFLWDQ